ncbi:PREDICTED: ecto-ADP-ribosyltransferase 4-like, partial [Cyprinodon variegatus]|uniref:ecto-ADP-ribosyltransferase 4-like n=1 Tax=Cyprinodon variegatus TaxID=28743 RepID=UPI000742642F
IFGLEDQSFPLDMAEESVDDMYCNCDTEMEKKVKEEYFKNEANKKLFGGVWRKAKVCAQNNMRKREKEDKKLTEYNMQAICVYTDGGQTNFYQIFNQAVRIMRSNYSSSFEFHSLHFWLTRAIQILNKPQCKTTYRRTEAEFTGDVNQEMRFGAFTSSSELTNQTHFGKKTCFKIHTCYGANLKAYPVMGNREKEWLIPPYEKFKITSKAKALELSDCDSVFTLNSTGILSNLNCSLRRS